MDREDLSAAIIQEMGAVFMAALAEAWPSVREADLAGMEQRLRQVGRAVFGPVVERAAAARAAGLERGACPACGGRLQSVDQARPRHLQGLVGDYTLRRAYYRCAGCGQGHAPLDARLGVGAGRSRPGCCAWSAARGSRGALRTQRSVSPRRSVSR